MTDRHPIYVGWFAHDGAWAQHEIRPGSPIAYPLVRKRLTPEDVSAANAPGAMSQDLLDFVAENGYVRLELTDTCPDQLQLVRRLVYGGACELLDGVFRIVTPAEVLGEGGKNIVAEPVLRIAELSDAPSGEVGRFEVDDQPSPPADR